MQSEAEEFVFGRERKSEEAFGVCRSVASARACDGRVLEVCQDGGVVTALLSFYLEEGFIDGAVVVGTARDRPFYPVPKLATSSAEVLGCAGSKYFCSPNLLALVEVARRGKAVAFVGTPCQIRAIRKMQLSGLRKWVAPLKLLIGLMCSECFVYEGLMEEHIRGEMGVDLDGIRKMNIKGRILVSTESEVKAISLGELKRYVREDCGSCGDFAAELADVSAGGLGLDGWTFVVVRTKEGEELFEKAKSALAFKTRAVTEGDAALGLLVKLSSKKRRASGF